MNCWDILRGMAESAQNSGALEAAVAVLRRVQANGTADDVAETLRWLAKKYENEPAVLDAEGEEVTFMTRVRAAASALTSSTAYLQVEPVAPILPSMTVTNVPKGKTIYPGQRRGRPKKKVVALVPVPAEEKPPIVVPEVISPPKSYDTSKRHSEKALAALNAYDVVSDLANLIPSDADPAMARAVLLSAFVPIREAAQLCEMPFPTLQHWIEEHRQLYDQIKTVKTLVVNQQAAAVAAIGMQSLKAAVATLPQSAEAWRGAAGDSAWERVKVVGYLVQSLKGLVDLCPGPKTAGEEKKLDWGALKNLAGKQARATGSRSVTVKETIKMEGSGERENGENQKTDLASESP